MGGLSRKALQIRKLAEKEKLPALFLDSGSLLFQHAKLQAKRELAEKAQADGIAAAMQAMNCQAIGIGAHDLAGGIDFLKELQERHKTVWLSMNLVDPEKKQPLFTPHLITKVGGVKIALFGLTDDQGEPNGEGEKKGYTILPWQEVLPKALAKIGQKVDMTILLSSYSYQINKEIAETVGGLHLILGSGHAAPTTAPYKVDETLIAQTGTRGKYLGMMHINWTEAGQWTDKSFTRIKAEEDRLKRVEQQLTRMEKQKEKKALAKDKEYKKLLTEKKQLAQSIKTLKASRDASQEEEGLCKYTNRFIPLQTSLPEEPEVKQIVHRAIQKANAINQQRLAQTGLNDPTITLQDLVGSQKCQECHAAQTAIWQDSKHALAWTTLEKNNQQFNEDCLICHVTLPFYDPDKVKAANLLLMLPKTLKNVGCEACHGPAAAHSAGQGKVPVTIPDEKVCLQCHTSEHDDHFVFAEKAKRLGCSAKTQAQTQTQKQETKQEPTEEEKKEESEGKKDTLEKPIEAPEPEQATASESAEMPTITPHGKKEKK
ncbi:MAG: UshA-like (seleno)protein [Candidatus Electrothrix aestuarii]|uniref:UshA-like (Seleno)protein n=1 Tax=Candidatus Electrothrix aestuarii TaxID=3062594 RepID=A0AAU8M1Q0_9BACT|nr:UshA-like (seleno)protein [Candidatus Electrothrix aestuarii]